MDQALLTTLEEKGYKVCVCMCVCVCVFVGVGMNVMCDSTLDSLEIGRVAYLLAHFDCGALLIYTSPTHPHTHTQHRTSTASISSMGSRSKRYECGWVCLCMYEITLEGGRVAHRVPMVLRNFLTPSKKEPPRPAHKSYTHT
jgi:hypothetical protein